MNNDFFKGKAKAYEEVKSMILNMKDHVDLDYQTDDWSSAMDEIYDAVNQLTKYCEKRITAYEVAPAYWIE